MAIKFFGQFLISRGSITREQLLEALELQQARNLPLGAYAVSKGYLTQPEAERVNQAQRARDQRFGDLAVELGMMTDVQVEELLMMQKNDHLRIGEALIEVGAIDNATLETALKLFREDQAAYMDRLVQIPASIPNGPLLEVFADLTPKLLLRVVGVRCKVSSTEEVSTVPDAGLITATIGVSGALSTNYVLSLPPAVARQTAERMLGGGFAMTDAVIEDAVRELCNVICGNAVSKLAQLGKRISISPPLADPPALESERKGVLLRFTSPPGDIELRLYGAPPNS